MATSTVAYTMKISRLTVDKLGVRLYDRVSAVLAELIANSYDADATQVLVKAPMGQWLATKHDGRVEDKGLTIEVEDDGIGMTPEQVNEFYLRVGAERRADPKRGDRSKTLRRKVMGRKGVGKLAPFGICQRIEVITSGGDQIEGMDEGGKQATGYLTAHLILDRNAILTDTDTNYYPQSGHLDGRVRPKTGTLLRLTGFSYRLVPPIEDLDRQLAQRFGISSHSWSIVLVDTNNRPGESDDTRKVGAFTIEQMEGTRLRFDYHTEENPDGTQKRSDSPKVFNANGDIRTDLEAGFWHDSHFYQITGWVAYAKNPYRDDLMAGIRIYCRGKIATQTAIFNLKSGFTGEHDVRSYLVGEIHADWLDEKEDLIQTDRRDILWSHELGQEFEKWGQSVVRKVGAAARNPMKKKTWELFQELSNINERVSQAFPKDDQESIRENALDLAKRIGQSMREDEVRDEERREPIVQLTLLLAPHLTLNEKLREAAESADSPISAVTALLNIARIAELSSFGSIADVRVKVIERLEALKDDPTTLEAALQDLIASAPWLIDPQWSPITNNQSFATLKKEFQKYYKEKTGEDIELDDFADHQKRADFVLSSHDNLIQIIEIKRPSHRFQDDEMVRLVRYVTLMREFLKAPANEEFTKYFSDFYVTLVCDGKQLSDVSEIAFEGLRASGKLTHINWRTFLLRTRNMHQQFLEEAERQKRLATTR